MDTKSVSLEEVAELLKFATDKGIAVPDEILKPLVAFVHQDKSTSSIEHAAYDKGCNDTFEIYKCYSALTRLTQPVTGKTILHSRSYKKSVQYIKYWALFFLFFALTNEIFGMYLSDSSVPDDGWWLWGFNLHLYLLSPLSPILWGGLGSCIFLLKRFSDIAADRTFDRDFVGGWQTRVLLGAILGGVIQYIYDPGFIINSGMDENALAFLVGLSVKVFYGVLEKLIEAVAEKLNLNAVRRSRSEKIAFSEQLVKRIAEGSLSAEQREALLSLLKENGDQKT